MHNKKTLAKVLGIFTFFVLMGGLWPLAALSDGAAPAASAGGGQPGQPGMMGMIMPFLLMFVVVYFLMIRPQQKKMKEHQALLGALKHGDDVVTNSGILGKVTGITDKVVTVEVADNVRIKMLKNQIAQVVKGSLNDMTTT